MKNISEDEAEMLACDIYYGMLAKSMLPKGAYFDKDEIIGEIYQCIAKMDGEYKTPKAPFEAYVRKYCPLRVSAKFQKWQRRLAKYENIEELDKRQYGAGQVPELATPPDYDGIELDLLLDSSCEEERTALAEWLRTGSQEEAAKNLGLSFNTVRRRVASALCKFKEALS